VLTTGSPVLMDKWINKVDGILEMWFAGSEGGNAIADVLLGNYNPSGKLPMTFPNKWEDCSAFPTYKKMQGRTYYADDIYVGYRHFDRYNIDPLSRSVSVCRTQLLNTQI
jgi:beta-glucosidase